jgi:hypothetical protein
VLKRVEKCTRDCPECRGFVLRGLGARSREVKFGKAGTNLVKRDRERADARADLTDSCQGVGSPRDRARESRLLGQGRMRWKVPPDIERVLSHVLG